MQSRKRKSGFAVIFISLMLRIPTLAQGDSICLKSLSELESFADSNIRILAIDFRLPANFDYSLIPKGLKCLRFLKPSKNLKQAGSLFEKVDQLETLELNGEMISFLPELLFFNHSIQNLNLTKASLADLWAYTAFVADVKIERLYLKEIEIEKDCRIFEMLFYGGKLSADYLFLQYEKAPDAEELAFLMDLFGTKKLLLNGEQQQVYVD